MVTHNDRHRSHKLCTVADGIERNGLVWALGEIVREMRAEKLRVPDDLVSVIAAEFEAEAPEIVALLRERAAALEGRA